MDMDVGVNNARNRDSSFSFFLRQFGKMMDYDESHSG
jgi:hypothetical protein